MATLIAVLVIGYFVFVYVPATKPGRAAKALRKKAVAFYRSIRARVADLLHPESEERHEPEERPERPEPEERAVDDEVEKRKKRSLWTTHACVAAHEAGHAIVALRCTRVSSVSRVDIAPDGLSGACAHDFETRHADEWNAQERSCSMTIALGGIAGELRSFGFFKSGGAKADLLRALSMGKELVERGDSYAFEPKRLRKIPFERAFTEDHDPAVIGALSRAFSVAFDILDENARDHQGLTLLLLRQQVVERDELHRLFGGKFRDVAHSFARFGPPRFL
jgi:hypothetical protein